MVVIGALGQWNSISFRPLREAIADLAVIPGHAAAKIDSLGSDFRQFGEVRFGPFCRLSIRAPHMPCLLTNLASSQSQHISNERLLLLRRQFDTQHEIEKVNRIGEG